MPSVGTQFDGQAMSVPDPSAGSAVQAHVKSIGDQALASAWTRLEQTATLPMQTYAFASSLARNLLFGSHLRILDAACDQTVEAILPMCRDPGYLARWRILGASEVYEPNDVLSASKRALAHIADLLAKQGRPLSFDRIPADSPLVGALSNAMSGRGIVSVRPAVPCPTIALDAHWSEPEMQFNSRRRSDFRRAMKKARAFGEVSFEILSPEPESFDSLFDEAVEVEVRSWKKDAGTAIAVDATKQAFFREYFRSVCREGRFRISFMRIDGRPVAMQMAVERSNRYWLFKIGFDEAYGKCSPGTLLMLHTIGDAARRGLCAYELLGDAEAWISLFWSKDQHEFIRLRTYPFGVRGAVALTVDAALWLFARCKKAGR